MYRFKRAAIFTAALLFSFSGQGQKYKAMMEDPTFSILQVKAEAEAWFETHGTEEGSGYKGYQRWLWANELMFGPEGKRSNVDPYFLEKEWDNIQENMEKVAVSSGWQDLGPYSIDSITGHYSAGLGRVECFYVDPNDQDYLYLGSRSGGFWKSTDGGQNWALPTTDFLTVSGVNTMAVSPTDRDSVLINLRNARNGTSHGIYRSTDGGLTWSQTPFNPTSLGWGGLGSNAQVYQLIYHPTIAEKVFVGTNQGLYYSTDDLQTWTRILNSADITHIKFHPTDANTMYVYDDNSGGSNGNVILISNDGGLTFTSSDVLTSNSGSNVEIAVSPACPDCLYAASANGVWKSTDEGSNFTFMSNPPRVCDGFAVSDIDTSIMIYGMLDIYRSSDGGKNFTQAAWWAHNSSRPFSGSQYVHADLREIEAINGEFYIGTDGFFSKSLGQGTSWQRLSSNTGIRENYALGLSQSEIYTTVCGSQDNGTSVLRKEGWVEFYGADGMEGIVHPLNSDWFMGSVQGGIRRLTFDGGASQQAATPTNQNGNWEAPLDRNSLDHNTLYHFGDFIYESSDFGQSWINIGRPVFSGEVMRAAIAPNSSQIMAVTRFGNLDVSFDGGQTFVRRISGLPNSTISDVTFAPNSNSTLVVTYASYQNNGNKVFISTDLGLNWQNITANLGDMPIRSVVIDDTPDHNIYLGAEIGVYVKSMQGTNWSLYNADLPNMTVTDMEIMHGANILRATTWGRGLWEYDVKDRGDFPKIIQTELTHMPTFLVPTDVMDQKVMSVISYPRALSAVYVKWSADNISLDSTIVLQNTQDSTWESARPFPTYPPGTNLYFKVFAVGDNSDTSATFRFQYRIQDTGYCMAGTPGGVPVNYINEVILPGLQKGSTSSAYSDFTSFVANMNPVQTYSISIKAGNPVAGDSIYAWIDYDNDSTFEQNERIDFLPIDPSDYAFATFTTPSFSTNDTVRMRIRIQSNGADPCNLYDGETEDYSVALNGNGFDVLEEGLSAPEVYPNPTQEGIYIKNTGGQTYTRYKIFSPDGVILQEGDFPQLQEMIDVKKLSKGLYFIDFTGTKGTNWRTSFLKN
jgi:photosystem II stability/assembly factor-like uncharacterized protein